MKLDKLREQFRLKKEAKMGLKDVVVIDGVLPMSLDDVQVTINNSCCPRCNMSYSLANPRTGDQCLSCTALDSGE